nr:leucine-rich repeat domain-containing protein [Treponema denticola]
MKNANTKSRVSSVSKLRARLLTSWAAVSVLAASLLFTGLLTGCPGTAGGGTPSVPVDPAAILKTDGNGKITGYKCAKEELPAHLVIPAKIGNEEIKEIDSWAFSDCTGLTSISLPASLTTIGEGAFEGCKSLTSITLPANLTKIDKYTFSDCTGLTSITLPANLTQIGEYAFYDCKGLTSVHLPASLTTIDRYAFYGCGGLASAVFEDKNYWKVYDDDSYSGTSTSINSSDLDNAATAAEYLREETGEGGYCDKYWKKN